MTMHRSVLTVAAVLLLQPPAAEARVLLIPSCGGAVHRVLLPGDPADPDRRRDCAKACHAITDRRGKSAGSRKGCCG